MKLRAFPAPEGSSCCLGSGDWPLDPHEILLHPRDLEKMRVPAFGYVAISRADEDRTAHRSSNDSPGSSSAVGCSNTRGRRPKDTEGEEQQQQQQQHHLAFCRAVPDDCLEPGELRAPAWLLLAAGVHPTQHLSVARASPKPPDASAPGFRVEVSRVPRKRGAEARPTDEDVHEESLLRLGRAIARRSFGCMVCPGSLLAAEVLGETVVLRVVAVTSVCKGDDSPDGEGNSGGPAELPVKKKSPLDEKIPHELFLAESGGGGEGRRAVAPSQKRHVPRANTTTVTSTASAPCLITSSTDIAVVQPEHISSDAPLSSNERWRLLQQHPHEEGPATLDGGGGGSGGSGGAASTRGRFAAHCGGREEVWCRRTPGLEAALSELHALILLSFGGLKNPVETPRSDRPTSGGGKRASDTVPGDGRPAPLLDSSEADPPPTRSSPHLPSISVREEALPDDSVGGRSGRGGGLRRVSSTSSNACAGLRRSDVLPAGVILCGPSGVGKTLALHVLAEDLRERHGVHIIRLLGPQIFTGVAHGDGGGENSGGGKAASLQGTLALALADARARAPAVIVLDELDVIFDAVSGDEGVAPLGEGARAAAALLVALDRASAMEGVTVLGATRRSPGGAAGAGWAGLEEGGDGAPIPAGFRKPGRFERCVAIGPPTQAERERILGVLLPAPGWEMEPLAVEAPLVDSETTGRAETRGEQDSRLRRSEAVTVGRLNPSPDRRPDRSARTVANVRGGREGGVTNADGNRGDDSIPEAKTIAAWAKRLSSVTPGMVGGDLERVVRTARSRAAQRALKPVRPAPLPPGRTPANATNKEYWPQRTQQRRLPSLALLTWQDAMGAVAATVPRALRGMDVSSSGGSGADGEGGPTWGSVGGFAEARRRLQRLVQWPWLHPEAFARMGVSAPAGALLYGPSGCGKSLVAQVLATECLANFVWVRSSELLSR